eukprot:Pgem_evm1s16253
MVENNGSSGTKCGHFDEELYDNELMTGYSTQVTYLSQITVNALADLGYTVDFNSDAIDAFDPSKMRRSRVGRDEHNDDFHTYGDDL